MAAPNLTQRMVCFVQKIGTDDAGYNAVGSPAPRLTINAALADLAANYPAASSTFFHIVSVGPGVFVEDTIALPPWTWIEGTCDGEGNPTTFVSLPAAGLTLSAGWSANATARGGLGDLEFLAASGSPIFDLTMPAPVAGNPARTIDMRNVRHAYASQIWQATSTADALRETNCTHYGTSADTIRYSGGTIISKLGLAAAAVAYNDTGGIPLDAQIYAHSATSAAGGMTFSSTSGAGVTARMGGCDNRNLTLNKAGAGTLAVSADAVSIPLTANVFYTGTATTANLIRTTDSGGFAPGVGTFTQIVRTGNVTSTAWGTAGVAINDTVNTFTDSSSAGAVAGVTCARSFAIPTFASAGGVTYAIAANVYIAGDPVITGGTATLSYGLYNAGKSRIDGTLTFGTAISILSGATGAQGITLGGSNQSFSITPTGTGFTKFVGASLTANIGDLVGSSGTYQAIYLGGVTPSANNFVITSNGTDTILSSPVVGGAIKFSIANVEKARFAFSTGNLLLGGLTTDGTGLLQFPASTTSAGGITLGVDVNLYRSSASVLTTSAIFVAAALRSASLGDQANPVFGNSGATNTGIFFPTSTSFGITTNGTNALNIDNAQKTIIAAGKKFQIGNARVAGVVAQGGTIIITDSNGVDQQVLCA